MATGDGGTHFADNHDRTLCGAWYPTPFTPHVTYAPDWKKVKPEKRCSVCDRRVKTKK